MNYIFGMATKPINYFDHPTLNRASSAVTLDRHLIIESWLVARLNLYDIVVYHGNTHHKVHSDKKKGDK